MDKTVDTSKADSLLKEAEKKHKNGFLKFLTPKTNRAKAASKLLHQAANIYNLANDWQNAANALLRSAQIEKESGHRESLVENYLEAASLQRKYNTHAAIKTMDLAVAVLCEEKKIGQAAKVTQAIAEIYEARKQYLLAARSYREAVEFYRIEGEENYIITIRNLLLKIAEMRIFGEVNKEHIFEARETYEKVITRHFETVGSTNFEEKLTDPFVKDLFFRVAILHLANDDPVGARISIEKYSELDPDFKTSREFKFVQDLTNAFEDRNTEEISNLCLSFDKENPLDHWKATVLNHAKALAARIFEDEYSLLL